MPTLGPSRSISIADGGDNGLVDALREIGQHRSIDTSGDGSPHYRGSEAVVVWRVAWPKLIPRG